jgi:hypothetical protein
LSCITRDPIGLLPASILIFAMAAWATYNFYMVGETCRMTDSNTYSEAWSRTISPDTEWIVQTVTVVSPIVSCLANTIVLTGKSSRRTTLLQVRRFHSATKNVHWLEYNFTYSFSLLAHAV